MTVEIEERLKRLEDMDQEATPPPWEFNLRPGAALVIAKLKPIDARLAEESRNALPGLIVAVREAVKALENDIPCSCTFGRERRGPTYKRTCKRCETLSTIETLLKK